MSKVYLFDALISLSEMKITNYMLSLLTAPKGKKDGVKNKNTKKNNLR